MTHDSWIQELDKALAIGENNKWKLAIEKDLMEKALKEHDLISKPSHYAEGRKYEPWEVIMDWKLNYLAGSAVKYISRYERKGTPEQDLRKAIRFLEMELEHRANNSRLG